MDLKPISTQDFHDKMLRSGTTFEANFFRNYFDSYIKQAENFAVAPYFWLIPNQLNMTLIGASENISKLTPHTKQEWIGQSSFFWMNQIHPDDQGFLAAAIAMSVKIEETMTEKFSNQVRLNIYCRMINAEKVYRWVLIQFPKNYFDSTGKIVSTLILTTDLSHLRMELKCMMTLIDPSEKEFHFYSASIENNNYNKLDISKISKREHEILLLMTKGLNSPEIANKLCISYHTVDNHKRNLRKKTKTKTSAELIHYVWVNNLI